MSWVRSSGAGEVADDLLGMLGWAAQEREHRDRHIARLHLETAIVHRAPIDARRGAGLEPADPERQLPEAPRQGIGGGVAGPSALVVAVAHMDQSAQEGADREHHARGLELQTELGPDPADPIAMDDQVLDRLLKDHEPVLGLQGLAHGRLVEHPIHLPTRRPHRRPLAGVQAPELDPGAVRGPPHEPAERVDLLDQVPLADPADGRVAGHLTQRLDVLGEEERGDAHARGRQGRLGPGVAAAHHDDVEAFGIAHHRAIIRARRSRRVELATVSAYPQSPPRRRTPT